MKPLTLMLCCNDERGNTTVLEQLELELYDGDTALKLECVVEGAEPVVRFSDPFRYVRIGDAARIIRRANDLGKWAHMGRVNTARRIHYAAVTGCDSIDGSGWSKYPKAMLARHGRLLRDLSEQRRLVLDTLAAEDRTS